MQGRGEFSIGFQSWRNHAQELAMIHTGQCHCGAIRHEVGGDPKDVALCHCSDCRRACGGVL
jgi:hypothetical protein